MTIKYRAGMQVVWRSRSRPGKKSRGVIVRVLDQWNAEISWNGKESRITPLWSQQLSPLVDTWGDEASSTLESFG